MKIIAAFTMVFSLITTFVLIAMASNYGSPLGMHPGFAGLGVAVALGVGFLASYVIRE